MPEQDMTPERPTGQASTSFEESQVAAAITKARALRPDLYSISGGSDLLGAGGVRDEHQDRKTLSLEEREERERRERLHEIYMGLTETLRRTNDPEVMTVLVRSELAWIEAVPEAPELSWIRYPQHELEEKMTSCLNALEFGDDPRFAKGLGLEEKRLVPRVIERPVLQRTEDGYEMSLEEGEAVILRAAAQRAGLKKLAYPYKDEVDGKQRIVLSFDEYRALRSYPSKDVAKIFQRTERIVEPPLYTREQLKQINEGLERLHEEILIRTKLAIAWYLYRHSKPPGFAVLDALAGLGNQYTGISNKEWQCLFSLGRTREGEIDLGDKIDTAVRLYTLLALGAKEELRLTDKEKKSLSEEEIEKREKEMGDQTEDKRRERIVEALKKQPPELAKLAADPEFVNQLVKLAGKNLFSKRTSGRGKSLVGAEINDFVAETIQREKGYPKDARVAQELGRRVFFMWGIAAYFDSTDSIGPATSDVTARIQHFETFRGKQARKGFEHGPDATLGKYPETLISSFLHSTLYNDHGNSQPLKNVRSLWDDWWREGKRLREISWDEVGADAWFGYNFTISNIGKKETGLFDMIMSPPPGNKIIDIEFLRKLKNTMDFAMHKIALFGGDITKWLEERRGQEDEKGKLYEAYTVGDVNEMMKEKEREIRELILIGAITSAYQNNGMEAVKYWGEWSAGDANAADNARTIVRRVIKQAGWGDEDWWKKNIIDQAKKFLKPQGLA